MTEYRFGMHRADDRQPAATGQSGRRDREIYKSKPVLGNTAQAFLFAKIHQATVKTKNLYNGYIRIYGSEAVRRNMASILIPHLSVGEREEIHLAVRKLHGRSLTSYLKSHLRELRAEARRRHPELFRDAGFHDLKPVDRTIYRFLTEEGRRTLDDLIAETGLKRGSLRASLERLVKAQLVRVVAQGGKTEVARGARKEIFVSFEEQ